MQLPPQLDEPNDIRASDPRVSRWLEAARGGVISRLEAFDSQEGLIDAVDQRGWSALHYTASRDHVPALIWLVGAGASVNVRCATTDITALAVGARRGHAEIVSALLTQGAKPLMQDKSGLTAVHYAAASGSAGTVRELIRLGGSLARAQTLKNRHCSTPIAIAARMAATATGGMQSRHGQVLKLLEAESKLLKRWFRAARIADLTTLLAMLEPGGVETASSESGSGSGKRGCGDRGHRDVGMRNGVIHTASDWQHGGTRLINVEDSAGRTALMACVRTCRVDVVRALLARGADMRAVDSSGYTALHHLIAVASERSGICAVLGELLFHPRATPLVRDANGRTAAELLKHLDPESPSRSAPVDGRRRRIPPFVALLWHREDLARRMRKLKVIGLVIGKLRTWHTRSAQRAYAPGGLGFLDAAVDFHSRATKVQRVERSGPS